MTKKTEYYFNSAYLKEYFNRKIRKKKGGGRDHLTPGKFLEKYGDDFGQIAGKCAHKMCQPPCEHPMSKICAKECVFCRKYLVIANLNLKAAVVQQKRSRG